LRAELFAALDREQPVQPGFDGDGTGGCSRPVSFALAGMNRALPYLVLFGPIVGLSLAYMAMLLVWHHRLSSGTLHPEARESIRRRSRLFASVVKYSGWAWLLCFILFALLWRIFRHE
jgi:hypothetical protein